MKKTIAFLPPPPAEEDIREYAYHLYCQGGCAPGQDIDNWLEAEACLLANIPKDRSHRRLHHHLQATGAAVEKHAAKPVAA